MGADSAPSPSPRSSAGIENEGLLERGEPLSSDDDGVVRRRPWSWRLHIGSSRLGRLAAEHPAMLWVLAGTEVWERFSYYGMRAMLVYYMTSVLLAPDEWRGVYGMQELAAAYGRRDALSLLGDGDPASLASAANATASSLDSGVREKAVQAFASQIYGLYTSLVYLTPMLGGLLADRIFGQHAMIITGACLMAAGHAILSRESLFLCGLGLIIAGNGCFKPNISARVGKLYDRDGGAGSGSRRSPSYKASAPASHDASQAGPGHNRRDEAFSIFYCAINLGAMLAPLGTGSIRRAAGYGWAFSAAGMGMLIGVVVYVGGTAYLGEGPSCMGRGRGGHRHGRGKGPRNRGREASYNMIPASEERKAGPGSEGGGSNGRWDARKDTDDVSQRRTSDPPGGLFDVSLDDAPSSPPAGDLSAPHTPRKGVGVLEIEAGDDLEAPRAKGAVEGRGRSGAGGDLYRVLAMVVVCALAVGFWAVFEQQGNSLALYAEAHVDRGLGFAGKTFWTFPPEYVQSINPVFILTFTPFVNALWRWQSRKGREPRPLTKMAMGCLMLASGYALLAFVEAVTSHASAQGPQGSDKVGFGWLVAAIALFTLGELYLSPVGLSFVSSVAPASMTSVSLGFWLMSSFGGNYIAGHIGAMYPYMSLVSFFTTLASIAFATATAFAVATWLGLSRVLTL